MVEALVDPQTGLDQAVQGTTYRWNELPLSRFDEHTDSARHSKPMLSSGPPPLLVIQNDEVGFCFESQRDGRTLSLSEVFGHSFQVLYAGFSRLEGGML